MVDKVEFTVEVSANSLKKLKRTMSDLEVKLDESAVKELSSHMIDLGEAIAHNTITIQELIDKFGEGEGGFGAMGGSGNIGGSSKILEQIRDMLENNGARLKSLADINEGGINEAAHKRLKQMSISQMILDDQLKTKRIWMRAIIGGGGGQSGIMRTLQAGGGVLFSNIIEKAQDVMKYQTAKAEGKLDTSSPIFKSQSDESKREQAGGLVGKFDDVQKRAEGRFGKVLGKLGGGKGMKMAGAVGLGALGLASLAKKGFQALVESSPMLKQMMKMLNFGVMMILRPIGDFFGFFLRPIFVYLLRKFIIPFYQTYLPMMQQMGMDLGETVVAWLMAIGKAMNWLIGIEQKQAGSGSVPDADIQAAQLKEMERMKQEGASQTEIANRMLEGVTTHGYVTDPDPELTKWGTKLPEIVNQSVDNTKLAATGITSTLEALEAIKDQPTLGTLVGNGTYSNPLIDPEPPMDSGSQFPSYYQSPQPPTVHLEINVEGDLTKDVMEMDLEPKMEQIATDVVKRTYNMENRR